MTSIQNSAQKIDNQQSIIDRQKAANDFGAGINPDIKIAQLGQILQGGIKLAQYWPAIVAAVGAAGTAWQYKDGFSKIISGTKVPYNKDLAGFVQKILTSPAAGKLPTDWQKKLSDYAMQSNGSSKTVAELEKELDDLLAGREFCDEDCTFEE